MSASHRGALALSAWLLLSLACVSTSAVKLGVPTDEVRPPVPPEQVAIYRTAEQVPGKYEEVAMLDTSTDPFFSGADDMFEDMRKKAGELGANAIILEESSAPHATERALKMAGNPDEAQAKGQAIAIYVSPKKSKKR